jgi:ribosomal protein L28
MRTCSLCGKKTGIGKNRSHAQNRTPRTYKANIQKVTMSVGEEKISGSFCTKCLKRIKKEAGEQKTALNK